MNQPYSLDLDGLDGISAIEYPSPDPAAVENMDMPVETCDSATPNGEGIVSVAGSSTLLRGMAALVAVGLIGLVSFMVLRTGESDMNSPSGAIMSQNKPSDELNGREPVSSDRLYPVLASGHSRNNRSVGSTEVQERHDEGELQSSVKAGLSSALSSTLGPIQNQPALVEDARQAILPAKVQAQTETSSEAMFESASIQSGDSLSEGVSPTAGKITPLKTSIGIVSEFTSNGALEADKLVLPFDFNETVAQDLSASALHDLKDLAEHCSHSIRVVGHTCGLGPSSSNITVARFRAIFVKKILVELGLSADRIEVVSVGEKNPIASNNTRAGRGLNRRVVVGCVTKSEKFSEVKL